MDYSIFHLSEDAKIEQYRIGNEGEPLVKVDSFMAGAKYLKEFAVNNACFDASDSFYPGIRMPIPPIYTAALARNLQTYIQELFGFNPRQVKKAVSRFSIVTTPAQNLQLLQRIPHFDSAQRTSVAAIHYLCDDPNAGTAMFRHRSTGYEFLDLQRYRTYMQILKEEFPEPSSYPKGYISGSTPEFEMLNAFEARYNRLIMYPGSSLHSGLIGDYYNFDSNPSSGRLTITTFLEFS